jgi:N-acetylglutamate synthase/N-acetylornithine aminotransferase
MYFIEMVENAYENDDAYATAKGISVGALQDRAPTATDRCWGKIMMPVARQRAVYIKHI